MAEWAGEELYPGKDTQSDEDLADYIHRTHNTVYHPAGTVRMGPAEDDMSPSPQT
ncbi:GMC oxidoreductase [Nesterenkonia pannonica]|uniref:GMC oxidoreductase n=1 Tax=Nesterenkonia pannonica TaxID=1548602 RepID=UPI0021648D1E|nr:GMC oxidoreductase [Nesterenkonia pannonica]